MGEILDDGTQYVHVNSSLSILGILDTWYSVSEVFPKVSQKACLKV